MNTENICETVENNQKDLQTEVWPVLSSLQRDTMGWWWWWLMALMRKISAVTRHLRFAWSLPVHGIAMATGDSSLRRVSTVTDLLSFISVARATQHWLIDGISALPQQRGWDVGLLTIDFQPLQTPASPAPTHTHTHTILNYPLTRQQLLCMVQAYSMYTQEELPLHADTHTHTLTKRVHPFTAYKHRYTLIKRCVCAHCAHVHTGERSDDSDECSAAQVVWMTYFLCCCWCAQHWICCVLQHVRRHINPTNTSDIRVWFHMSSSCKILNLQGCCFTRNLNLTDSDWSNNQRLPLINTVKMQLSPPFTELE